MMAEVGDDPDDDLVRQRVKRPVRLRGEDAESRRTRENREALGGMRNPRVSNMRVTGHNAIGKKAFKVLSRLILADGAIESAVMNALGDKTKTHKGPSKEQIILARSALFDALGLDYRHRTRGASKLEHQLYGEWLRQAKDYDVDIQGWLAQGTPMGIESEIIPRGVCPEVHEATPE